MREHGKEINAKQTSSLVKYWKKLFTPKQIKAFHREIIQK